METKGAAKQLGELLVERRLITPGQLEEALRRQRLTKEFLGAILVQMGAVTPDALLSALSAQFQIPVEQLTVDGVDWRLAGRFPSSAFSGGRCFPIRADSESVTVAISNPLELTALSAIEKIAGFRTVKPVLVLEQELQAVLRAHRERALRQINDQLSDHG